MSAGAFGAGQPPAGSGTPPAGPSDGDVAAGVVLRRADEADDAAIRALLARSYPDNPKALGAYTRWQYWDNPFGPTRAWVWAEPSGRVVCHWSAVAVPLWLAGRRVIGAKGVDIATDPAWRGRGLFSSLAQRLIADCREQAVPALLSHPNPASAPAVARAGAELVARVPAWVRPVDAEWLAARLRVATPAARGLLATAFRPRRAARRGAVHVEEATAPPDDLDRLWAGAACPSRSGVVRDGAWWQWRYVQRPDRPYRILTARSGATGRGALRGAAVTTVRAVAGGRVAHVLEWLAADEDAAAALGAALTRPGAGHGAHGVVAAALPGTALARHARRSGFRRLPRALEPRPLRFLVAAGSQGDAGASKRLAAGRWSFAWGDLDHL